MTEKIEDFFASREAAENKKKEELLIKLGLYNKVYAPGNRSCDIDEYPYWDFNVTPNRRYKKVAIEITDEEYEKLKKLDK